MKRLLLLLLLIAPLSSHAAFTKSLEEVAASSQYVSRASVVLPPTDLTIEGWYYFSTTGADRNLGGTLTTVGHRSFFFVYGNPNTLQLHVYGNGEGNASVAWTLSASTWYHLAVTYQGSSGDTKFYVNGVQQGTTQTIKTSGLISITDTYFPGGDAGGVGFFNGDLSNHKLWNTIRTAAQISSDQCATLGATSGLIGEWSLDNVLTDNSGNSYTLTGTNSPAFVANVPSCSAAAIFDFGNWFPL